jgi:hypothetical protein
VGVLRSGKIAAVAKDLDAALLIVLVSLSRLEGVGLVDVITAVLDGAAEELGRDPTRSEVEDSVSRLIALGYARPEGNEVVPSESGVSLVQAARRLPPASRLTRIRDSIERASPSTSASWALPDETWEQATLGSGARQRQSASDRLHIVEGQLRAIELAEDIIRVSRSSADPEAIGLAWSRTRSASARSRPTTSWTPR